MKVLYLFPLFLVAACGGGSSNIDVPTASTGYAKTGDSILNSGGITFRTKMPMIYFAGNGERQIVMRDVSLTQSPSADNTMTAVVDGATYVMPWNPVEGRWEGTLGSATAILYPQALSGDEQLGSGYLANWDTSLGPDNFSYLGINVTGFNTSPVEVGAQTGTAAYSGTTELIISHGGGDNVFASGAAAFNANFDAGTIDGMLTVSTDFADNPSNATADNAEISILSTAIDGNGFNTSIMLNPTDFGMETFTGGQSEGQFFGVDAADIGGYVFGGGTKDGGTTDVLLQGGFVAAR